MPHFFLRRGFSVSLGMGGVVFILLIAYFFYGLQPSGERGGAVSFKITKGESFRSIAARLSQERLVRSIAVLKAYAILLGKAQKFQPGLYELSSTMSVPQLIGTLTAGGRNEVTITIPEGLGIRDIDALLAKAGVIEEKALSSFQFESFSVRYPFLNSVSSLEGFLFPDTYRFRLDSTAEEVLTKFLDNFQAKAWPFLTDQKNWYDMLILASYIEREVPDFNDRQLVAGILFKRLKVGMPLQVDATISYAKCNGKFIGCDAIKVSRGDLGLSTPYNTYQRLGWTPTPIANPGQAAIKAAVTPAKSSYLYYLSAALTKKTIFSRTLEEHNRNKEKYL